MQFAQPDEFGQLKPEPDERPTRYIGDLLRAAGAELAYRAIARGDKEAKLYLEATQYAVVELFKLLEVLETAVPEEPPPAEVKP